MTYSKTNISGHECYIYDCGSSDLLIIQPVDDHDLEGLDSEVAEIVRLTDGVGFTLAAFKVGDWNADLSPWEAPAVFGDEGFAGGAEETLRYVTDELVPALTGGRDVRVLIGGYSLAGFFALWAAYQTDVFRGVAAASPSVWFPGWIEYAEVHSVRADKVYLSLGDREERTRNPVMRTVGDNIRRQYEMLLADPACGKCALEFNQGNHFKEPDIRTAKGFAWLLKEER
ncbi:MAG: esterase [Mogibacterium sp.]|nr:esterase [Mogibacterium sp.]